VEASRLGHELLTVAVDLHIYLRPTDIEERIVDNLGLEAQPPLAGEIGASVLISSRL
jgi:hypothetical protein